MSTVRPVWPALALALTGCEVRFFRFPGTALVLPAWLVCGVIGAWIATSKGRGGCSWFLLCALLGPIGIVIAAVVSRRPGV